jgi:hypothetical protein
MTATSEVIGEPHSGQKFRSTGWPLSPVSWKVLSRPWIDSDDLGTPMTTEKAVPACFWQLRQWQTATSAGSALAE